MIKKKTPPKRPRNAKSTGTNNAKGTAAEKKGHKKKPTYGP